MRPSRVCELTRPENNKWTLKDRLRTPQTQSAIVKFAVAVLALTVLSTIYALATMWAFAAMPMFHTLSDTLVEEQWRSRTACDTAPSEGLVILDCRKLHYAPNPNLLNQTVTLTLRLLTTEYSSADRILNDWMKCNQLDSVCMTVLQTTTNAAAMHPLLLFALSWLSCSLPVLWCCARHMLGYFADMRIQLQTKSAEGAHFHGQDHRTQSEYLAALFSQQAVLEQVQRNTWGPMVAEPYRVLQPAPPALLTDAVEIEDEDIEGAPSGIRQRAGQQLR